MPRFKDANSGVSRHQFAFPEENIGFDVERFDELLRGQGVEIEIFSSTICPIDATTPDDSRHEGHGNCSNGFLYRCEGRVLAAFVGNSGNPNFEGYGIERDAVAYMTVPRFYDNPPNKPVVLGHYYRIYLADCETPVVNSEKVEHSLTGSDRLAYPAMEILRCIDNRGKEYAQGSDFNLVQGNIVWAPNRAPGFNVDLNKGEVFSVLYTYKPFFYVKHIPHEIRVTRVVDDASGEEKLVRMPYQLVLEREWAFHNQNRVPEGQSGSTPPTARTLPAPRSGGFGPR